MAVDVSLVLHQQRILMFAGLLQVILNCLYQILIVNDGGFDFAIREGDNIVHCRAQTLNEVLLPCTKFSRCCLTRAAHSEKL